MKLAQTGAVRLGQFTNGDKTMPGIQLAGIQAHRTWRREGQQPAPDYTPIENELTLAEVRERNPEPMDVYRFELTRDFLESDKDHLLETYGERKPKRPKSSSASRKGQPS